MSFWFALSIRSASFFFARKLVVSFDIKLTLALVEFVRLLLGQFDVVAKRDMVHIDLVYTVNLSSYYTVQTFFMLLVLPTDHQ